MNYVIFIFKFEQIQFLKEINKNLTARINEKYLQYNYIQLLEWKEDSVTFEDGKETNVSLIPIDIFTQGNIISNMISYIWQINDHSVVEFVRFLSKETQ